jgi:NitT/TauT family transport system permease protein
MAADHKQSIVGKLLERSKAWAGPGPLIVAVLLLVWELVVRVLEIRHSALPSPARVLLEIGREAPQLQKQALITGLEALEGLLLAVMLGLPLAALTACWSSARNVAAPVLSFLHKIPLITLAPLIIIWFGYGIVPAAWLAFLVCFLPLVANIQAGFDSVSIETVEIVKAMGAGSVKVFTKVRLPACLPFALNGLKIALPLALGGASVSEFIGSDEGLGYLMLDASSKMNTTQLFAALTVLFLMALGFCYLIRLIERVLISWPVTIPAWTNLGRQGSMKQSPPGRVN